jgi:hypothetical protein
VAGHLPDAPAPPPGPPPVGAPHSPAVALARKTAFWTAAGLLAYAQAGYGLLLAALARRRPAEAPAPPPELPPDVSLIVAAYNEERVIADRVVNALALEHPRERLEVIVCADGCTDGTVAAARAAGADLVLDLPRRGKVRTQDAGVERARAALLAFSDANALWEPDALGRLVAPFADPLTGYVCGQVSFEGSAGTNQEGLYWRYEMWLRGLESRLASITGGNGAIYAVRRQAYLRVDPIMGHDLSFPFNLVRRGWRARYEPRARAREKMVPSIEGEFARKRRMMSHGWPIVLRGGMLSPRGYPPLYALMIASHRLLRYAAPFLHAAVLVASLGLVRHGAAYRAAVALQSTLALAALAGGRVPLRPLLVARYYVLTMLAVAAGLWDWLRVGTEAGWEQPEGTR